ncbi:MAG: dimethylsulfoniopropionate demethylase [SAR324 cluster bacterium]|nr:dimethylsulfoniopropionate demethylase [SAR324 cluster bacterium]
MSYEFTLRISQRIRKSPFFDATIRWGASEFTVYNHMMMPFCYESYEADYWKLVSNVTLWDVACERQIEITGPDALQLAEYMTPRDVSKCKIGQCQYALITAEDGGIINDPVLLRLGEQHFWFSLADSDALLYAKGIAQGLGLDVTIKEPDVSPLAIQGPNNLPLMEALFGDWIKQLGFFRFRETELDGIPLIVARSGWSKQGGFELYLRDGMYGDQLWEKIMEVGKPYDLAPASPNPIERIEGGLLSYGSDMTIENNPFELHLSKYCHLDKKADFIGREALLRIKAEGAKRYLVGLEIQGEEFPACENHWPVYRQNLPCGMVTSAIHSPRLKKNIALSVLSAEYAFLGSKLEVDTPVGKMNAKVTSIPFS